MGLQDSDALKGTIAYMELCITHAEPELTARPRCRVFNSYQGHSTYSGFDPELIIYVKKNLKLVGFCHMLCCTDRSGIVHHICRTRAHWPSIVSILNSHQGQSDYPDFVASISTAMHVVEAHKY